MAGKRRKSVAGYSLSSRQLSLKAEKVFSNPDLLNEILLRLPAVSVLRFKCVSKQWYSIVSDSKFSTTHTQLNARPSVSNKYVLPSTVNKNLPPLSDIFGSDLKCLDNCNGVFLCSSKGRYVVFNPITKSYKILPEPPVGDSFPHLAYIHSKYVYKVVKIDYLPKETCFRFAIYSSDTASWKEVTAPLGESLNFEISYSWWIQKIYSNGAIHWMDGKKDIFYFRFDLHEEKLEAVQLPPKPKLLGFDKICYFGECGGRLFLVQTRLKTASGFRILQMGKVGWIVKCRFNLRTAFPEVEGRLMIRDFSILQIKVGATQDDVAIVILSESGRIVSYDFKSKMVKELPFSSSRSVYRCDRRFNCLFQASLATFV